MKDTFHCQMKKNTFVRFTFLSHLIGHDCTSVADFFPLVLRRITVYVFPRKREKTGTYVPRLEHYFATSVPAYSDLGT